MLYTPANKIPFPLTYHNPDTGVTKKGSAYEAIGQLGLYYGLAANDLIASLRWSNPDYVMVITGFGVRLACPVAFTVAQLVGVLSYKALGLTTDATGGTDISSVFGIPRRTKMPATKIAGVQAATGSATPGKVPLTHGTRTGLTNVIFGQSAWTGTVANINDPGVYLDLPIANDKPVFIEANEGFEVHNAVALPSAYTAGCLSVQLILDWLEVPTEIIDQYFSEY
jgi:hypothetical protein